MTHMTSGLSWGSDIFEQEFFVSVISEQLNVLNMKYGEDVARYEIVKRSNLIMEEIYLEEQEHISMILRRCEMDIAKCRAGLRRDILLEQMDDIRTEVECFEISFRCWEVSSKIELRKQMSKRDGAEKEFLDLAKGVTKLSMCKRWVVG